LEVVADPTLSVARAQGLQSPFGAVGIGWVKAVLLFDVIITCP